MTAHWWNCVLGLLCMSAELTLSTRTVSQDASSISLVRVNSSTEIKCFTSLPEPMGVYLNRGFHGTRDVVFLNLDDGRATKHTVAAEFVGRMHITPDQQIVEGYGFTFQLSLLGLEDTDWYYCTWMYFKSETMERVSTGGTVIIVTDPQEQCKNDSWDLIFVALSVTALTVILFLFIGVLIVKYTRFQKRFVPARAVKPSRPNSPECVSPQQSVHHCPYLITSVNSENALDFRGIL